jgi:hypothetical protein
VFYNDVCVLVGVLGLEYKTSSSAAVWEKELIWFSFYQTKTEQNRKWLSHKYVYHWCEFRILEFTGKTMRPGTKCYCKGFLAKFDKTKQVSLQMRGLFSWYWTIRSCIYP